jgi:hypothetical protein
MCRFNFILQGDAGRSANHLDNGQEAVDCNWKRINVDGPCPSGGRLRRGKGFHRVGPFASALA